VGAAVQVRPSGLVATAFAPPKPTATNRFRAGDHATPRQAPAGRFPAVQATPSGLAAAPLLVTVTKRARVGDQASPCVSVGPPGFAAPVQVTPSALDSTGLDTAVARNWCLPGDHTMALHDDVMPTGVTAVQVTPSGLVATRFAPLVATAAKSARSGDQVTASHPPAGIVRAVQVTPSGLVITVFVPTATNTPADGDQATDRHATVSGAAAFTDHASSGAAASARELPTSTNSTAATTTIAERPTHCARANNVTLYPPSQRK